MLAPEKIVARGTLPGAGGPSALPRADGARTTLWSVAPGARTGGRRYADDIAYVYELFPILGETAQAAGGDALRRGAADARDRPGPHRPAAVCCCSTSLPWVLPRWWSSASSRPSRS